MLVAIQTWQRPRQGDTMQILARGFFFDGKLYTDLTAFRTAVNLADHDFDQFLSRHPLYYRWYHTILG
jgi:hypothetical protein